LSLFRAGMGVTDTSPPCRRLESRDHLQEPEVDMLSDCSSCSSVDTAAERHTVLTHCADSSHRLDTRDDVDEDDEIINVVDDLVS